MSTPFPAGRWPTSIQAYRTVTPLTYRDGATLLELFSAMRNWLENEVVGHIEAEVDRIINETNDKITALLDAVTTAEEAAEAAAAIKLELEGLETRVNALATNAANSATAASGSAATATEAAAVATAELTALRELIATAVADITEAAANEVMDRLKVGEAGGIAPLDVNREIPNVHMPSRLKLRPNTVVVGSSNALNDANSWTGKITAGMNWNQFNFAVGGTGFTQGDVSGGNKMIDQLIAAAASSSFTNDSVGQVFIADCGNDIRSEAAESVIGQAMRVAFDYAKTAFPNARVMFVPVMWGPHEWNNLQNQWRRLGIIMNYARSEADGANVEFIEDSWLWHHGDTAAMRAGELHYTDRGHSIIANMLRRHLRGQSTMPQSGPTFIDGRKREDGSYAVSTNANADYSALTARREGARVFISGSIRLLDALVANTGVVATLPPQFRPTWPQELYSRTGFELGVLIAEPGGALRLNKASTVPGTVVTVADSYRIDQ